MKKGCSTCNELGCDSSYSNNNEPIFGGNTYSCKKGYFMLTPYPHQPQECIENKTPRSVWNNVKVKIVTDEELEIMQNTNKILNEMKK